MQHTTQINSAQWVLERLCCDLFGFSKAQLYHYRATGKFAEGIHYARNPANRITYCVAAIEQWMAGRG